MGSDLIRQSFCNEHNERNERNERPMWFLRLITLAFVCKKHYFVKMSLLFVGVIVSDLHFP